jgi:hypothetical protein
LPENVNLKKHKFRHLEKGLDNSLRRPMGIWGKGISSGHPCIDLNQIFGIWADGIQTDVGFSFDLSQSNLYEFERVGYEAQRVNALPSCSPKPTSMLFQKSIRIENCSPNPTACRCPLEIRRGSHPLASIAWRSHSIWVEHFKRW